MTMSQIDSCLSMGAIYFRREVFLPYKHREWVEGCKPHPGNIVEPASLAVIEALSGSQYDVASSLPPAAIKEGRLSSLQLESIIKAVSTSSFTSSILSLHLTFPSSFAVSLSLLFLLLLSPSLLFLIYLNLSVYLSLSSSISISLSVSPFPPLSPSLCLSLPFLLYLHLSVCLSLSSSISSCKSWESSGIIYCNYSVIATGAQTPEGIT